MHPDADFAAVFQALAEDIPHHEFESIVNAATASMPDAEAARFAEAAHRAYRSFESRRERLNSVSALYETARDLAEVRDVDAVLEAIVRRAHRVIPAADATFLFLRDEDSGDYYIQASVGLLSAGSRQLKMPKGRGICAIIERTRAPVQVRNYGAGKGFEHVSEIDRAFADEGVVSVLGVPFMLHGEVVGILYASNREERPYRRDETTLLTRFADHAAIALGNAQVVADLETAHRTVLHDSAAMERAAQLHESLTVLMIRGGDLDEAADALAEVFRQRLTLVDGDGEVITARGPSGTPHDEDLKEVIEESRRTGHCVSGPCEVGWRYVVAIGSGRSQLSALVLYSELPLSSLDIRTFERAAQIVTLMTLRQEAVAEAEDRVRGELLAELLGHRTPLPEATRLFAQSRHFDLTSKQIALAIRVPGDRRAAARRAIADMARNAGGLGGDHGGVLAAVVPGEDPYHAAEQLRGRLGVTLSTPAVVCAAMPVDPLTGELAKGFTDASRCLPLLLALGKDNAAVTTRDLALYGILFDPDRAGDLRAFIDDALEPLASYDREHKTDLLNTVNVFLRNGSNATKTARDLYVHLNTVTKRLDRAATLLGPDWQSEPTSLRLRLALHLHDLAKRAAEH